MPTLFRLASHGGDDLLERRFGEVGARHELFRLST